MRLSACLFDHAYLRLYEKHYLYHPHNLITFEFIQVIDEEKSAFHDCRHLPGHSCSRMRSVDLDLRQHPNSPFVIFKFILLDGGQGIPLHSHG